MINENNNTNILEHITKSIGLIYGFLVFCGALYFSFYYRTFHINIFRYLDLSEISVSFLNIIVPTLVYLSALAGYFYSLRTYSTYMKKKREKRGIKEKIKKVSEFWKIENLQSTWTIIAIASCPIFLYFSQERLSVDMNYFSFRYLIALLYAIIPILLATIEYNLKFITINTAIILIMASVYEAIGDVHDTIEDSKHTICTIITKDNDTITTNEKFYFVGRTNQYLFLYNSTDESNTDIPTSEIKKFHYK